MTEANEREMQAVRILWDEVSGLGVERGKQLLQRMDLQETDFEARVARELFAILVNSIHQGRVPIPTTKEYREALQTDELLNPNLLDGYADAIKLAATRRSAMTFAKEVATRVRDAESTEDDIVRLMQEAPGRIQNRSEGWESFTQTVQRVEKHIRDVADGKRRPIIQTGFHEIDERIGGLPGTLVVVAARPGVGKSALIGSMIHAMVQRGESPAIFSMEDSSEWLAFRFLAQVSGVHQFVLRNRALNERQWVDSGNSFSKLHGFPIWCNNREGLTAAQVLRSSRSIIAKGATCVFLDNMTAMSFSAQDRRDLLFQDFLVQARALANETGVPFVVLSHVAKGNVGDIYEMPKLSDCSETTAFEKLSRLAFGLCLKKPSQKSPNKNRMTLAVLKNTNGESRITFDLEIEPSTALLREEQRQITMRGVVENADE